MFAARSLQEDGRVSENLLRIVPTVPAWTPVEASAAAAAAALREMCPFAADLLIRRYADVTFIDQGGNFERLRCPACAAELETAWWQERMEDASATRFTILNAVMPCCNSVVSLNDLDYEWPAGFARFELQVRSPGRSWLSPDEMAQVSALLGITVRQVISQY
jgi:hypothetical protein